MKLQLNETHNESIDYYTYIFYDSEISQQCISVNIKQRVIWWECRGHLGHG